MELNEQEFLSTDSLARYLSVSKKFIEKHRARRIPGACKIGYKWRFRRSEIEKRILSGQLLLDKE